MQLIHHKGYAIREVHGRVAVFDDRFKHDPAVWLGNDITKAKRWIEGYRDGEQWAVDERNRDAS